jgi:hypothetical protein
MVSKKNNCRKPQEIETHETNKEEILTQALKLALRAEEILLR